MSGAGDGDGNSLRIGGWLPESEPSHKDDIEWGPSRAEQRPWDEFAWDIDPEIELADEAYRGRRRSDAPAARLWIVIAFVLIGLGAAVAIPLAMNSSRDGAAAPATSRSSAAEHDRAVPPGGPGTSSPTPSPSATQPVKAAPAFTPATYEAEAPSNTRGGSARVRNAHGASGKKIVNRIGDWTDSELTEANNGTLSFNAVTVPADGRYIVTVFYTFLEDDPGRSAMITVNRAAPMTVSFARPDGCCPSSIKISIMLKKGVNKILFSNSASRAPAVDRIVISRP
jgi:hypothetical protein